ncbi:MAG: hypothetical protein RR917_02750 [Eggerthellaceae bacterium]
MAEFDIEGAVKQIMDKATGDEGLLGQLKNDPAGAIENMTGIDIPNEQIDAVIEKLGGVEGLVGDLTSGKGLGGIVEDVEQAAGGIAGDLLGGLFGKK